MELATRLGEPTTHEGFRQRGLQMTRIETFTDAAYDIIILDGESIGRLYVDRREDEIRLIDIALLPEHRGGGLGTAILKEILAEGASVRKLVRIHVEQFNPAMRLYERLGFSKIEEQGVYHLMEWTPETESPGEGMEDG